MSFETGMLTEDARAVLRGKLVARMRTLREELRAALHADDPVLAHIPNRHDEVDDDAVADLEMSVEAAGVERDTRELAQVEAALRRLDGEDFGRCTACGQPIVWERLLAVPHAVHCIACERAGEAARAPARL